jgi:hypothetical protein
MGLSKSMNEVIAATLSNLGRTAPANIVQTILLKDDFFVGYKCRYDGGYAIMRAGSSTIEFYTEDGKLLTTAAIEVDADKEAAA